MKIKAACIVLVLFFLAVQGLAGDDAPAVISPGGGPGVAAVDGGCPTFSWSGVPWAKKYRVTVFSIDSGARAPAGANKPTTPPVLSQETAAGGSSWTPSAEQALADGQEYAWCVGALDANGAWTWSEMGRFRVQGSAGQVLGEQAPKNLQQSRSQSEGSRDSVANSPEEKATAKRGKGADSPIVQALEGAFNTFYGSQAGNSNSGDENRNSFFGAGAGYYNTTGAQNTFLGYLAGGDNITGNNNTFVGAYAGDGNRASDNTFIGHLAGNYNYDGLGNTLVGSSAGYANTSGANNTFIGRESGFHNYSGLGNTFIGIDSGYTNSNGDHNTFLGRYSGYLATGSRNVFIGSEAGYNETGSDQLYVDNSNTSTPLLYGDFASNFLKVNGSFQIAGAASLDSNATVNGNVDVSGVVAAGSVSLDGGSTVIDAAEINILDGKTLVIGAANNDQLVTRGYVDENDDIGGGLTGAEMTDAHLCKWDDTNTRLVDSLLSETAGAVGVAGRLGIGTLVPASNLEMITAGSNNVLAVTRTDGASFKLSAMGASGQLGTISAHPVNFMTNNVKRLTIAVSGNVGIGVTQPSYPLHMASGAHCTTGGVWTNASSLALKENIAVLGVDEAAAALRTLNPVKYNYKTDASEKCVGFIAEEVPELVAQNDRQGLSPMDIVAVLTKVVQEQQKEIRLLKEEMAKLKRRSRLD